MQLSAKSLTDIPNGRIILLDFLAILFTILAPYLNYVFGVGFVFESANLAVIGACAVIAAGLAALIHVTGSALLRVGILAFLLLLFVDIQLFWFDSWLLKLGVGAIVIGRLCWLGRRHLSLVTAVFCGTAVAITVVLTLWNSLAATDPATARTQTADTSDLPVYVHLVLDEFMSPEGFESDLAAHRAIKSEVRTFFAERGFRLFGNAYSPYYDTYDSVSSAFNMIETSETEPLRTYTGRNVTLLQNRYFESVAARGYTINVYQSDYLDYCAASTVDIRKCRIYTYYGPSSAALASLGAMEKAQIVLTLYANLATVTDVIFNTYKAMRAEVARIGLTLPRWVPSADEMGPIAVMPVLDELARDLATAQRGSMYFAHLLIPHAPYSLDESCRIRRPVMSWRVDLPGFIKMYEANTDQSRQVRYEGYIAQVRCTLKKIAGLLDTLQARGALDDATIVIHGDHGSRLAHFRPMMIVKDRLTPQDFMDAFLTLYAVKAPGVTPGYDRRPASLAQLTQALVAGGLEVPDGPGGGRPPQAFFRQSTPSTPLHQVPFPCLPEPGSDGQSGNPAGNCPAPGPASPVPNLAVRPEPAEGPSAAP